MEPTIPPLNPCPCGKPPSRLILQPGSCSKWAWVTGSCCTEWHVEFRTRYKSLDSAEAYALAVKEWNQADRHEAVKQEMVTSKYREALADAISRPMGVVPASAEGLVTDEELAQAKLKYTS